MLQDYWKGSVEANANITGDGWITYVAALGKITEVKEVASLVSSIAFIFLQGASRSS